MGVFQAGDPAEVFEFSLFIDGVERKCSLQVTNEEFWDAFFQSVAAAKKAAAAFTVPPTYIAPGDPTIAPLPDGSRLSIAADGGIFRDGIPVRSAAGTPAAGQLVLVVGKTIGVKGKTSGAWSAIDSTTGKWSFVPDGDPLIWK